MLLLPLLKEKKIIGENFDREKLLHLVELYKVRMRTLTDFTGHIKIFYSDDVDYDPAGADEYLKKEGTKDLLIKWRKELSGISSFDKTAIEEKCRALAEELKIKPARLIHSSRMAISGRTVGAGIFEMMELMGKDTVLKRIDYAIKDLAL